MQEILTINEIRLLVDTFYGKVQEDKLLAPVFNEQIQDRWPQHLEKMYTFWQTVLLDERTYYGAPFPPHAKLRIDATHFERWMQIFLETVDGLFTGEKATEAKWRAGKMAEMFQYKLESMRNNPMRIL